MWNGNARVDGNVEWQRKSGWQHNTTKHLTRACPTDRTTRRRTGLNHLSQHLTHWFPATRLQALLFALKSTLYQSRHALRETLHISILVRTTHESQSVGQSVQSTTSIESSKVKNPNHTTPSRPLTASSRGNDRIGSSDLLDSGG